MNHTLSTFQKLSKFIWGKKIFSFVVSRVAPYFGSIKPLITHLEPNHCICFIKKRRAVQNHIKTVHVIAICNGLEMAMGVMAEASVPKHLRWIPKGMTVNYTAKANSDIRCIAKVNPEDWKPGDMLVPVQALDINDTVVVEGHIKLWITEKPR
ncbi:hotdog fold domain-containing protein [Pleionea sediminis]|uniref:hotdog fold domain-containing protein n=1 Tax=Pleionea sediminis TaxID=2569479 RepID=UPI001184DD64|nr:hotdog fold domain-containing protein [Pleionea sediminis]